MAVINSSYVGRFAPSPTGPLHFGSLIAAAGSYLDARANRGRWLLRIDDIDPPREQPGATDDIRRSLEQFGFEWDGPVLLQSTRSEAYRAALEQLRERGLMFYCTCSRKQIAEEGDKVYPGTCRERIEPPAGQEYALRLRVDAGETGLADLIQGAYAQDLRIEIGDFVLQRRDGLYSYHMACSVDDAFQGITHVVRGADLLDSTPRQIHLQQLLGLPIPHYAHLPVAAGPNGQKLSKQNLARALDAARREQLLWDALQFLGQQPPRDLLSVDLKSIWEWAAKNWSLNKVPKVSMQTYKN
ncbi:MAG TPA: tRNA glutamyl-Q(34) synthetase GluQRS [Gammaproteobacteria bacterium]|nr:tRNA glutamyl-Q(34) synthetase GluQRS [Gammaproteobacteria bacterium]